MLPPLFAAKLLPGVRPAALLVVVVLTIGCAAAPPPAPRPDGVGTLVVTVEGFPNDQGQALVNLFLDEDGFPGDPQKAFAAIGRPIVDGRVEIVFEQVPAGPFAVSVFHDEDEDFELGTGLLGIPTELWGVSRDAGGFLGPPAFESARLDLEPGQRLAIDVPLG